MSAGCWRCASVRMQRSDVQTALNLPISLHYTTSPICQTILSRRRLWLAEKGKKWEPDGDLSSVTRTTSILLVLAESRQTVYC